MNYMFPILAGLIGFLWTFKFVFGGLILLYIVTIPIRRRKASRDREDD